MGPPLRAEERWSFAEHCVPTLGIDACAWASFTLSPSLEGLESHLHVKRSERKVEKNQEREKKAKGKRVA